MGGGSQAVCGVEAWWSQSEAQGGHSQTSPHADGRQAAVGGVSHLPQMLPLTMSYTLGMQCLAWPARSSLPDQLHTVNCDTEDALKLCMEAGLVREAVSSSCTLCWSSMSRLWSLP